MEKMDRATEARILSSIERAIRLTKEGMESNKALLKIASEDRLHPEIVKRMAEAMNVSRTRAYMQSTPAEKRADSFPLVDANWIIDQMYPRKVAAPVQEKAANWIPDEYGKVTVENFFEVKPEPATFAKAAEALEAPKSPFRESRLMDKQAGLKSLQRVAESDFRAAMFELMKQAEAVAMQFRDSYRFNFPEVERRVFAKYGSAGRKMMDMIYGLGSLGRIKMPIKRASLTEPEQLVWDGRKEPYNWIDKLCKQAEAVEALGRRVIDREYNVAAFNDEHGFKQAWEARKEPGLLDDILDDPPPFSFNKQGQPGTGQLGGGGTGVPPGEAYGRAMRGGGAKTIPGQEALGQLKDRADNPALSAVAERQSVLRRNSVAGLPGAAPPPAPPPPPPPAPPAQTKGAEETMTQLAARGIKREEAAGRGAKSIPGRAATEQIKEEADNPVLSSVAGRQSVLRRNSVGGLPGAAPAPAPAPAPPPPANPPPAPASPPQSALPSKKPATLAAATPSVLPSGAATKPRMPKLAGVNARPFAKSAVDPFAVGAVMGPLALGLREPPELSKYREVLADVYDPVHEAKMDSIKSKAMINDFLSNDPILSSYDPEMVTNVYNQVASLSPAAARQPALMRGLLRKAIQQGGVIEPFEVQQLTQVEKSLRGDTPATASPLYTAKIKE